MTFMQVAQLWKYPVKSMVGLQVESCSIDLQGIKGDRLWAVRDLDNGGIRGAKKFGELMQLAARFVDDLNVEICSPDGRAVRSDDPNVHQFVSSFVGVPVRLEGLRPASDLDHFRRGRPGSDDVVEELRAVFGRDADEPLPDFSVFPPEVIEFESPPGTYYDCWPLMIMSTSALSTLRNALPDSVIDERRFRPSLVIDTGDVPGHPEFSWKGRRATLGNCEVEFLSPCPRCVMVTRAVSADIPVDRAILRHIVRDLDQNLGVYARVTKPGTVSVGDAMTFIS
ncbi:MAG: MOSC domain-containing protein [Actinomycetota bacterium]